MSKAAKTISIETIDVNTNNLGIHKNDFTSLGEPIAELVSNAIDAARANKTDKEKIVDVSFEEHNGIRYIVIKNTGRPVKDFKQMLDLGYEGGMAKPEHETNHLRGVGFKYAVGYFSSYKTDFVIETRRKDGWHIAEGPYTQKIKVTKTDEKDFIYGDRFVTRIAIRVERNISVEEMLDAKEFLRRKFSVVLMKDKALKIFFDGEELSYVIHGENEDDCSGNIIDKKDEILNRLFVGSKDCEEKRNGVRFVKQGGFTFAEIDCPVINGKIHVLSMQAPSNYHGTNVMGVSVFNFGTLVEYSCGDVIHVFTRRATNKMKSFKSMPNNRNEFSTLATYVDLLPGEAYIPPFSNKKDKVNWSEDAKSRQLRMFIDDVVGGYYREFVRIHSDLASRIDMDAFIEDFHGNGNHAYVCEGVIWTDGFKGKPSECARTDGILLRKTPKNIDRINAYKKAAYSGGRRGKYRLTSDDFDPKYIEPDEDKRTDDWTYDFKIVEFKNIKHPRLTADDIASAEKYVKFIAHDYGLDRKRIPIVLIGNVDENNYEFNKYLDIARKEDGFLISVTQSLVKQTYEG